jgi:hypothetical protein
MREQANNPLRMQESTIQYHLIAFLVSGTRQSSFFVRTLLRSLTVCERSWPLLQPCIPYSIR